MFECRANAQLIDPTQPRLFWIIQWIYVVIAGLLCAEAVFIIPNAVKLESRKVIYIEYSDYNELDDHSQRNGQ